MTAAALMAMIPSHSRRPDHVVAWSVVVSRLSPARPLEPRFSGVPFGQWLPARGSKQRSAVSDSKLAIAAATLEKHAGANGTAETYRRAGVAHLLAHGASSTAVVLLRKAAVAAPYDASILSDLAGAYLVSSGGSGLRFDTVRALDAAHRAAQAAPDLPHAWFNLGLALDALRLPGSARTAWRRASETSTGPWAEEAYQRQAATSEDGGRDVWLQRLEPVTRGGDRAALENAVSAHCDLVGQLVERRLLRGWADAVEAMDRGGAGLALQRAAVTGDAIRAGCGDSYYAALAGELRRCDARCAAGWRRHLDALDAWDDERFRDARAANEQANELLGQSASAVNAGRSLLRATLARLAGERAFAENLLRSADAYAVRHGFLALAGRARWQRGLLASEGGDFGRAMAYYGSALQTLEPARDREAMAVVESLLAYKYQQLEDVERAWQHAYNGISGLAATRRFRRSPILSIAAFIAGSNGLDGAALAFRAPLIESARSVNAAVNLASLLADDAANLKAVGRRDLAGERIREATARLDEIDDPGTVTMLRARVRAAEGQLLLDEFPRRAAAVLGDAIDLYGRRGNSFAIPALELDRGRALARTGAVDEAERAFTSGIEAAERERRSIAGDTDRVSALAARWDLYASLIDLRLQRQDEAGALQLLHRARAVNLAERLQTAPGHIVLPPGVVAVEYAVLPTRVSGWVAAGDMRHGFEVPLSRAAVGDLVVRYREAIARRESAAVGWLSRQAFTALLGPIRTHLAAAGQLVVVPDGPLHDLPFSSLIDPDTGHAIVDRLPLAVTPSLALYARQAAPGPREMELDAFIVGNPDRTGAAADDLPDLPASRREAILVARHYPERRLAIGRDATRQTFLEYVGRARMVHFAGHGLISDSQPHLSRLLLAPAPDDALGVVFAKDVEERQLAGLRLVVLSACETARGRIARGEGVVGLARGFLAAGVPAVIATLWPIEDERAVSLFTAFHAAWAGGMPAADALRQAQLESKRDARNDVLDWGGVVLVGQSVTR
jgi:CHAT domain-containing protein